MIRPSKGTVDVSGVPWAYSELGQGPLVLFLHGTLGDRTLFARQAEQLAAHMRCVCLDWPGHGESGFAPTGWDVDDLVDGVRQVIFALGASRVALVGLSQGGAISLRLTLRYPELVGRLVTFSAGPDGPAPEAAAQMAALGQALAQADAPTRRALLTERQRDFHAPGWVAAHPAAAAQELEVMAGHDPRGLPHALRIPGRYGSVEDRLGEIACPALVAWGEHDVRAFWGPRMVDLMPTATLAIVPDAGHHVPYDNPERTTSLLTDFFAQHPWTEQ